MGKGTAMKDFRSEFKEMKRVVVKVGSNVISKSDNKLSSRVLRIIVEDICELIDNGVEVVLVSSGAVTVGKAFMKKYMPKNQNLNIQQSASAIGQPKLINMYSKIFEENERICSQILLTHDDFRSRKRFLYAKENIETLLKNQITPILNENDSISFSEISVGDNDHLAAQTAQMINADLLLIITSASGLYDKNPVEKDAKLIPTVEFDDDLENLDFTGTSSCGRGGMESKVNAVKKVTPLGIKAIISSKENDRLILDPMTKQVGTIFLPEEIHNPEDKGAWLVSTRKHNCFIEVNKEYHNRLGDNSPLYPEGIVDCQGDFYKGDSVELRYLGEAFASGISEFSQRDLQKIQGLPVQDIERVLGYRTTVEVVKSINLILDRSAINERIS